MASSTFAQHRRRHEAPDKKIAFLDSLAGAFQSGMHCDVELVTDDGQSVKAHRVVMATKSRVFNAVLQSDLCKLAHTRPIRIPDLKHNELKCLLRFLYTGNLPEEAKREERVLHVLLVAAEKYDIPFLREACELHIVDTLSSSNALKVLELSTSLSGTHMKEMAISAISRNYKDIISSKEYEEFAVKKPMLALHVTKALLQNSIVASKDYDDFAVKNPVLAVHVTKALLHDRDNDRK